MKLWKTKKGQSGQAAIEFVAISVVLFFFLLFFLSISILLVVSDYVEYATFMAARTYKSGNSREAIQQRNAKLVFDSYFEKIQPVARRSNLEFIRTETNNVRTSGILASYDMDMFYLPPVFTGADGPASRIRLNSETHLGRDPSFQECRGFFDRYSSFAGSNVGILEMMEDNGC
ncbi:hypothetical protein K2X33_06355 [bacterium]|nr:hypothetical protein [bacterium]